MTDPRAIDRHCIICGAVLKAGRCDYGPTRREQIALLKDARIAAATMRELIWARERQTSGEDRHGVRAALTGAPPREPFQRGFGAMPPHER